MRVARFCRKERSWVMNSTAPLKPSRASSSQAMAPMSRWLVGSSSSSRSGSATRAWASSTRRRQPPDSSARVLSAGSCRRLRVLSTSCCRRQPSRASSSCWTRVSLVRSESDWMCWLRWWNSASSAPTSASPSATTSNTVRSSARGSSCGSSPIFNAGARQISPSSANWSPLTRRSRLDLPVPLRPMMHTRSPRAICQDTLSSSGMAP
ncbi:hypothetical protein FQZ97_1020200 [compost metagenome]